MLASTRLLTRFQVNYDLDTKDWENGGVNAKARFQSAVNSGTSANTAWLALAHDIHDFTVHGFTQWMIDLAKSHGFKLVPVGECLGDPAANWYRDPVTGGPKDITGGVVAPPPVKGTSSSASTKEPESSSSSPSSSAEIKPTAVSRPNFGAGATHTPKSNSTSAAPTQSATTAVNEVPEETNPSTTVPVPSSVPNAADKSVTLFGSKMLLGLMLGAVGMGFMVVA